MSNSAELVLADAIVAAINAGSYTQTVTAVREPVVEEALEANLGLTCFVIPGEGTQTPATFDGAAYDDVMVDIELRQKVTDITVTGTDALATLADKVFDYVRGASYFQAAFQKAEKAPPADPEKLREKRLFATGSTFVFKLVS